MAADASTCASRTRRDPLDGAAPAADAPARLRPRRRRRRAAGRGPHRRGGRALPARRRDSRPARTSCCSGPGLARAQAGDLEGGVAAVRRAAEENPNWLVLLDRLSPEFAAGRARPCVSRSPEGGTRRRSAADASRSRVTCGRSACAATPTASGLRRRCPTGEARVRALAHVAVERHRVDGRRPGATAVAPRPATVGSVAGVGDLREQEVRGDVGGGAKSAASLPSTLSAFRPVATPVALVVNGAPVGVADLDAAGLACRRSRTRRRGRP